MKAWIDEVYSDNLYSETRTKYGPPTYRRSKQDMLNAFQKAYEGQWRGKLIEIYDCNIIQNGDAEHEVI